MGGPQVTLPVHTEVERKLSECRLGMRRKMEDEILFPLTPAQLAINRHAMNLQPTSGAESSQSQLANSTVTLSEGEKPVGQQTTADDRWLYSNSKSGAVHLWSAQHQDKSRTACGHYINKENAIMGEGLLNSPSTRTWCQGCMAKLPAEVATVLWERMKATLLE